MDQELVGLEVGKKRYEPNFKARVALECIKNIKSTIEICSEYKIPATNLYEWRDRLLQGRQNCLCLKSSKISTLNP
jgi:transposase-like protein